MFSQKTLNLSQVEVLNTLFIVDEVFPGINKFVEKNDEGNLENFKIKSDEQPGTTDMLNLDSEESAAQRRNQQGKGLKY